MKVNFSKEITDLDGTSVKGESGKPFTLAAVALNSLLSLVPGDNPSGEDKAKAYALALRINGTVEAIEVSAEEVVRLKTAIGKLYAPLVVGRSFELLEKGA